MQNLQTHSGPQKKYGANILKHLLRDCNSSWCMIQMYLNSLQMNVQLKFKNNQTYLKSKTIENETKFKMYLQFSRVQ